MQSKSFAPSFAVWLLDSDLVDEVSLQCPDVPWFQHVLRALDAELQIWSQAEAKQKRICIGQCVQHDCASGRQRHASAIKPLSLGTLEPLTIGQRRRLRLLRSERRLPAKVKILDDKLTPLGSLWNFPGAEVQAKVVSVQGQAATLDVPAHIAMAAGKADQTA